MLWLGKHRFHAGEEKNGPRFCQATGREIGDIFVNLRSFSAVPTAAPTVDRRSGAYLASLCRPDHAGRTDCTEKGSAI